MDHLMPNVNDASGTLDWLLSDLRFTGFITPGQTTPLVELFRAVSGSDAGVDQTNRQEGSRTLSGAFHEASLTLTAQLGRLDAVVAPIPNVDPTRLEFPFLAPLTDGRSLARQLYASLLKNFNAFNRLALAETFVLPKPDLTSAYATLGQLLPKIKIDDGISDFLYRVNRPKVWAFSGRSIVVNRVSTWSAASLHAVAVSVTTPQTHRPAVQYAVHLQTDVNTAVNADILEFDLESKMRLADALETMSTELATHGDIQ
jgi:hypothetical protein